MKEISSSDIMHIGFLKMEAFTGSSEGMRYLFRRSTEKTGETEDEKTVLLVAAWPEPFSYDKTPEEDKIKRTFSFDEAGVSEGLAWLNEMKKEKDWEAAGRFWQG